MQEQRKEIILKEINYWKENRMLPEHYCDFLLTLYTEGNGEEKSIKPEKSNKSLLILSFIFLALIPTSIFLLYFTELSFILQMAISLIFLIFSFGGVFLYNKKQQSVDVPTTTAAIIFLLMSVRMVLEFFSNNIIFLYIILLLNCAIWFYSGRKYKLLYFTISSYIGAVVLILLIIFKYI